MPVRISAIVSDYDGTLCPTMSVNSKNNQIPPDLQNILLKISEKIPVCVISTKDFRFLRHKIQFAKIVSCLLGLEIFHLFQHRQFQTTPSMSLRNIIVPDSTRNASMITRYSLSNAINLLENSLLLKELGKKILDEFQGLKIEDKFTYIDRILAGVSIDYRHIQKWQQYKTNIEPQLTKTIRKFINSTEPNDLFVQTYSDHPFVDVYPFKGDKGEVLETIVESLNLGKEGKVLYLGDSENDNPAFHKADLSIGIRSDMRIKTKLDSDYIIEFNELRPFLQKLEAEDFVFNRMSQNLL